jgi:hypothetical protein
MGDTDEVDGRVVNLVNMEQAAGWISEVRICCTR